MPKFTKKSEGGEAKPDGETKPDESPKKKESKPERCAKCWARPCVCVKRK